MELAVLVAVLALSTIAGLGGALGALTLTMRLMEGRDGLTPLAERVEMRPLPVSLHHARRAQDTPSSIERVAA